MSYGDVMNMPVYERRFFINMFKMEMENRRERVEEAGNNVNGKGRRSKKISGEALKTKMKNNEIPN